MIGPLSRSPMIFSVGWVEGSIGSNLMQSPSFLYMHWLKFSSIPCWDILTPRVVKCLSTSFQFGWLFSLYPGRHEILHYKGIVLALDLYMISVLFYSQFFYRINFHTCDIQEGVMQRMRAGRLFVNKGPEYLISSLWASIAPLRHYPLVFLLVPWYIRVHMCCIPCVP